MRQKQNNIKPDSFFTIKEAEATSQEADPFFTKTKTSAIIALASVVIGGLVIYEKLSTKDNSPKPDSNQPIEYSLPTSPQSDNEKDNSDKIESSNEKYGKEISIKNYNSLIPNLPADRRDALNSTLYNIVETNLGSNNFNITDANIREDSIKNEYDKKTNIYSGSFIVDMQSINQSYLMTYLWTDDENNNANLGGYTATASCLPSSELIYGNFNTCKDDFNKSPNKIDADPILDYLPHSTFDYEITGNYNTDNKLDLNVIIFLSGSDIRNYGEGESISKYKSQVIDWVKSIGLNPSDYSINYTIK